MNLEKLLLLSALLFCIGLYGLLTRKHLIGMLLSVELMLNAANLNFIAFAKYGALDAHAGSIFSLFTMAVAASEMAVALAIIIVMYRNKRKLSSDSLNELHG